MARDTGGIMSDPSGLKRRMAESRHKDFIQAFTDGEERLLARFSSTVPAASVTPPRVLYQDRLADAAGARDRDLTYAVGAITNEEGEPFGAVLVAFRMDGVNREVVNQLRKGFGITVFFVGLILVQNLVSRRGKLRLLDYELAQAAAKRALEASLRPVPELLWGKVACKLERAGTVIDLDLDDRGALAVMCARVDGPPVEASFAALRWLEIWRGLQPGDPAERAGLALAEWDKLPHPRKISLLSVRVTAEGAKGVSGLPVRQIAAPFVGNRLELFEGSVRVTRNEG
jgi:hypothetical protein